MKNLIDIINTDKTPNIIQKQGGKRQNSGRKPAPYKTKTIAFRVREEWVEEIKKLVKERIAALTL
jgi:hypothetical protein